MASSNFVSSSERKILLTLSLLIALFYYTDLANYCVKTYNDHVAAEEQLKMELANDPGYKKFTLTACHTGRLWELLFHLQFFTNPAIFAVLIYAKKFREYFLAFSMNAVTACGIYLWVDYSVRFGRELLPNNIWDVPLGEVVLSRSTGLEQLLCLLVCVLLGLQLFFMARFATLKFQREVPLP